MTDVAGALIEMNAHMVVTDGALRAMIFGGAVIVIFALLLLITVLDKDNADKAVRAGICAFFVALGIAVLITGNNMARVKEIRFCANGPIQIEQVAAKYEIVKIDGKMITVREK